MTRFCTTLHYEGIMGHCIPYYEGMTETYAFLLNDNKIVHIPANMICNLKTMQEKKGVFIEINKAVNLIFEETTFNVFSHTMTHRASVLKDMLERQGYAHAIKNEHGVYFHEFESVFIKIWKYVIKTLAL